MRYIDADALIKKIFPYDGVDKKGYSINAKAVAYAIANIPTADVVPKSEVDRLYYNLRAVLEERAEEKAELAKEIFEEIVQQLRGLFDFFREDDDIREAGAIKLAISEISELKKKYTEERE